MNKRAVKFFWSGWSMLISGGALSFSLAVAIYYVMLPKGQPVRYELVDETPVLVQLGQPVKLKLRVIRDRPCPGIVDAWFVDAQGAPVHRFPPVAGGFTTVGISELVLKKPTDMIEEVGTYFYRARVTSNCPNGRSYITMAPDIPFLAHR